MPELRPGQETALLTGRVRSTSLHHTLVWRTFARAATATRTHTPMHTHTRLHCRKTGEVEGIRGPGRGTARWWEDPGHVGRSGPTCGSFPRGPSSSAADPRASPRASPSLGGTPSFGRPHPRASPGVGRGGSPLFSRHTPAPHVSTADTTCIYGAPPLRGAMRSAPGVLSWRTRTSGLRQVKGPALRAPLTHGRQSPPGSLLHLLPRKRVPPTIPVEPPGSVYWAGPVSPNCMTTLFTGGQVLSPRAGGCAALAPHIPLHPEQGSFRPPLFGVCSPGSSHRGLLRGSASDNSPSASVGG